MPNALLALVNRASQNVFGNQTHSRRNAIAKAKRRKRRKENACILIISDNLATIIFFFRGIRSYIKDLIYKHIHVLYLKPVPYENDEWFRFGRFRFMLVFEYSKNDVNSRSIFIIRTRLDRTCLVEYVRYIFY